MFKIFLIGYIEMSKIGLNTLNSNPGSVTSSPTGFPGGNINKAVSELKSYTEGTRKTRPSQKCWINLKT